jgi:hypothetical protein
VAVAAPREAGGDPAAIRQQIQELDAAFTALQSVKQAFSYK